MPQSRMPAHGRVQEVFEQILAQPEFRPRAESPIAHFFAAVRDFIQGFFERFLPNVGEAQVRLLSWFLMVGAIGLVSFLAWRWIVDRSAVPGRRRGSAPVQPRPRDAPGWVRWAESEATEGRLREAATGLYQAVVLHLEAEGALRYGEWKTPGDYALETEGNEKVHRPFRSFLAHFVTIAFGPVEPSRESLETLFARAERLGCPT